MLGVIGLSGQMQNGKDTIADMLAEKLDWDRAAFAAGVKNVFMSTFDVDFDFIEEWKVQPENPPGFDLPMRKSLQFIGDGFRKIQSSIWVDLCFRNIVEPAVISDVRYVNELQRIRDEGGINILVWRPGFENDDPNGSESQIKSFVDWHRENNARGREPANKHKPYPYSLVDYFVINDKKSKEEALEELGKECDEQIVPLVKEWFTLE